MTNTETKSSKAKILLWVAAASAILSVFNHAYLLKEHFELRFGEISGDSLCNINDLFNCAAVSASKYSEIFGFPVALLGLAANAVLGILIGLYAFSDDEAKPAARRVLLTHSGLIAGTSVVMALISLFLVSRLCPFCIVAYALSFIGFISLWLGLKPAAKSSLPQRPMAIADFKTFGILSAIALFAMIIGKDKILRSYNQSMSSSAIARDAQEAVLAWQAQPQVTIDTTNALEIGAPLESAKMVITEFADYRCPHCKHAAPKLKAFVNAHPDARLIFLAWPLDGECNTVFGRANGASCMLARLTYCSLKSGGQRTGWATHEYIFENQDRFPTQESVRSWIPSLATKVGLDAKELETCADSPDARQAIEKQTAVGTALQLQGTPTVYVNGKKLSAGQSLAALSAVHKAITGN